MNKNNKCLNVENNEKIDQLDAYTINHDSAKMTTNMGLGINDDQKILKAGENGPALLEDFIFREKITHFDHERIPERIVHARGFGAHGVFVSYKDMSSLTMAKFLSEPNKKTPVFVRFSTVVGFRGSPDTVRDVRGFATKFYTEEGNYDLVGNNMPVFFIQDAIKFPDLIHSLKPEPNNEIPQAQSAHDTFWDFVANNHETAHNVMWLMSDRAIPLSYRTMDGFGIHTFKMINNNGEVHLVKFHWKSLQGVHSLVWDEAQKIAGKDPDFNRRDLFEAIENGMYPEWELGIQVMKEEDQYNYDFDVLDSTKLWPEEIIPVQIIGKMTLNKNVTNYFSETEQVAFCPANLVPGIGLSNDPMLQGRLFSYLDTQISRLGGPNFHELPINKPIVPIHNNQRDGMHRMQIDAGVSAYFNNAINNGEPHLARKNESSYDHVPFEVHGKITRDRKNKFFDYYTQPALFWNSMTKYEKNHIINAFRFELGKCKRMSIRQAVVDMINNIDGELAKAVALGIGVNPPKKIGANKAPGKKSKALSMANQPLDVRTKKIAVLLNENANKKCIDDICIALKMEKANIVMISNVQGVLCVKDGEINIAETLDTTDMVLYDALFLPDGISDGFKNNNKVKSYITNAYAHGKPIIAVGDAIDLLNDNCIFPNSEEKLMEYGVLINKKCCCDEKFIKNIIELVGGNRFFNREKDFE